MALFDTDVLVWYFRGNGMRLGDIVSNYVIHSRPPAYPSAMLLIFTDS